MQLTFKKKYDIITKIIITAFVREERAMLFLESRYSPEQLLARWDERTSPARFAGNDDVLDVIYVASRKKNRVFLIRKARRALDPFTTVFRGKVLPYGEGSVLQGSFSKRLFDYLLLLALLALDIFVYQRASASGLATSGFSAGCVLFACLLILLAIPFPRAKKQYLSLLKEITEG